MKQSTRNKYYSLKYKTKFPDCNENCVDSVVT